MKTRKDTTRRRRWGRWSKRLEREITDLVISNHIYEEWHKLLLANEQVQQPDDFHRWTNRNYLHSSFVAIRRQIDPDSRSVSLANLLRDITRNNQAITRRSYVLRFPLDIRHAGESQFDEFAGPGEEFLPKCFPRDDLAAIEKAGKSVQHYVNKRVAHLDRKNTRPAFPRHGEVQDAIRLLERVFLKYKLLLTSEAPSTLLPHWLYDWKEIFNQPWLPRSRRKNL